MGLLNQRKFPVRVGEPGPDVIDALAAYCATLQMEISLPKTKVMVVSAVPAPAVGFTCIGNPVEQVATFKYFK